MKLYYNTNHELWLKKVKKSLNGQCTTHNLFLIYVCLQEMVQNNTFTVYKIYQFSSFVIIFFFFIDNPIKLNIFKTCSKIKPFALLLTWQSFT